MTTVSPAARPTEVSAHRFGRRGLLRVGALAALAGPVIMPVVAACSNDTPPAPDALLPVLSSARQDVAAAHAAAAAFPDNAPTFTVIATVREQHANAIQQEITRAGGATPSSGSAAPTTTAPSAPAGSENAAFTQLVSSLRSAQQQAAALVPTVPRYRAGLVGSVSAGCASLVEALGT